MLVQLQHIFKNLIIIVRIFISYCDFFMFSNCIKMYSNEIAIVKKC